MWAPLEDVVVLAEGRSRARVDGRQMSTNKLSTGDPSTLGGYLKLCRFFFGDDSPATDLIRQKIREHDSGEDEPVVVRERQMIGLLTMLHKGLK